MDVCVITATVCVVIACSAKEQIMQKRDGKITIALKNANKEIVAG